MRRLVIALLLVSIASCSSTPNNQKGWIEPAEAVRAANANPENGIHGTFVLTVKAIGRQDGRAYLNSELDYRDQRCLTVEMTDAVASKLEEQIGAPIQSLKNQRILITGQARRVRIVFRNDQDADSGYYYYQTHVMVTDPAKISRP
jgi:hypothetical protein